ncbi:signal recognition particle-docking protein FtsY [Arenibaculum pallidiluteum]|uniref:signal recognition particle-docking protein FtsY n=1 Tax=Arenibaculum pallidiluteum TaxID=2812559 RepID=UPI001A959CDB|nr:signal recognition particle-docking protein FtsY [Arenibaculum pallidiluteum]
MLRFWKRKPAEEQPPAATEPTVAEPAATEPAAADPAAGTEPAAVPAEAEAEASPATAPAEATAPEAEAEVEAVALAVPPAPEPEPAPAPGPASEATPEPAQAEEPRRGGWLSRLREGLTKSTSRLTEGISGIFTKRRLDEAALEELEELLITADLGPTAAARITADLARTRFGKEISPDEVRRYLAERIAETLAPVAKPLELGGTKPHVILVVGVNGAGKTTTIGKLAKQYRDRGLSVMIAAGDTFRAAAVQQLQVWGERAGVPVIAKETGADAAGLTFDALERARREAADVLLVDTAGRLQNKTNLMAELQKIVRVVKKIDETAPHTTLLVLDATTGQNALSQAEVFRDMVQVGGLVLTKLDGSARGGVLVALADRFGLPVHAIGVGEGIEDLRPFEAGAFARSLMGIES